jgi:hypothetical protein
MGRGRNIEGLGAKSSLTIQVNTMKPLILALACTGCGVITGPSRTDNHRLVTGSPTGTSADERQSEDTSPKPPICVVTSSDLQPPCVEYCRNYGACIGGGSLDCEDACARVIEGLDDPRCLQPVYSAFECLRSRICSDGMPELSATRSNAGEPADASTAAHDDCRLESLAVDCRLTNDATLAALAPNPFSLFATGAGINDCYLLDQPAHETADIGDVLERGLTGLWRCPGSSHTYSVTCIDTDDRVTCSCELNDIAYAVVEAPLSWPRAADENYWQYIVEQCGWRY